MAGAEQLAGQHQALVEAFQMVPALERVHRTVSVGEKLRGGVM